MSEPKKTVYSFSAINRYRTCPRQYQAWLNKEVKFQPTVHTQWGNAVHKAGEDFINYKKPLSERYSLLKPYMSILSTIPGTVTAEKELAVTEKLEPCDFWDKKAWLRGKIDVLINQEDKAHIWDWKTGSAKPNDFNELRCFSLLTFLNHPEIEKTKNTYIWLKNDSPPTTEIIKREETTVLLDDLKNTIEQIEESVETEIFKEKRSGLCGQWCDVINCRFNGKSK